MYIRDLEVEGIGRFSTPAHVVGFDPGVNVLPAGNEVGKSTLFKAIRACLFTRHDSKTLDIRDLASDGSQLPATVQLTIVHKGRIYGIRKSFLRSPCAALSEDGREIARGKQADEAVWDILGLRPGSGRTIDDGAFGLLWVGQGGSFAAPVLGAGASSLLNAAIESEVGVLVGGERARQVLESLNGELRRYLTGTEQHPKTDGPLARTIAEMERWKAAEAEQQAKFLAFEDQFAELLQHRCHHSELTDPAASQELPCQLAQARNALAEARAAEQEVGRREAEAVAARRAVENAAQRLTQYRALTTRIDANREDEAGFSAQFPGLQSREQDARAALTRAQEHMTALETMVQTLSRREQQLEKLVAAALRAQRKVELAQQLRIVEQTANALCEIDAQLGQIHIKPKTVEELDELERQIAMLNAQLSAAAAQLAVEVKPEGVGKVRIGAAHAKDTYSAPVVSPVKIAVADLAVITVTPAANPRHEQLQELGKERAALLKAADVHNATEAHAALQAPRARGGASGIPNTAQGDEGR
jgi:DNA repair exonuclease SbcCD ATPase subunit